MKKKILIILTGILLLSPRYIKANYDPTIMDIYAFNVVVDKSFKTTCINPKSEKKSEVTIKKNEILSIIGEGDCIEYYGGTGKGMAGFCFKKNKQVCELVEDDIKNVHIQDLEFNVEKNRNDMIFMNNTEAFPIGGYDEEYVTLYSGPSALYSKKKKIKENSEVKVLGRLKEYTQWYYIETQNVKGWIEEYSLMIKQNKDYINATTQKIYKDKDKKEIAGIIPANAIVKNPYYANRSSLGYYISYNGINGYIDEELYEKEEGSLTLKYDGILYSEKDVNSKKLINNKIKKGQKINYDYIGEDDMIEVYDCEEPTDEEGCEYHYSWYHTTIGKESGWLLTSDNLEEHIKDYTTLEENNIDDITIEMLKLTWNKANLNGSTTIDIKINNKTIYDIKNIYLIFKDIYGNYVKTKCEKTSYGTTVNFSPYQFKTGDYILDKLEVELNNDYQTKLVFNTSAVIEKSDYKMKILAPANNDNNNNNNENKPDTSNIEQPIKEMHKINNTHLYIGIGSAISITITSIILIILINKRRKDKSKN